MMKIVSHDKLIAAFFFMMTLIFIIISMTNPAFFDWVFERHHNQWSWYIRPLFLIPFCYASYKQNWSGVAITIFCLFTSMFWFNKPEFVDTKVEMFLQFEKDWLNSEWDIKKVLLIVTVPISFFMLGLSFWKRSLMMGLGVVVLMATGKIVWAVLNAGESGKSIIIPAVVGLVLCFGLIFYGYKRIDNPKK